MLSFGCSSFLLIIISLKSFRGIYFAKYYGDGRGKMAAREKNNNETEGLGKKSKKEGKRGKGKGGKRL